MDKDYTPKCFSSDEYKKTSGICKQCIKYKECGEKVKK